jgi:hypothetical protein
MAMNVCDACGIPVHRTRLVQSTGKWLGFDCGCLSEEIVKTTVNPYADLTLDHVHDERGQKVRVTSKRQLHEAEKRYHFKHHVANMNEANFGVAPSHRATTVADHYRRKFAGR